jgi:hypothetical protein
MKTEKFVSYASDRLCKECGTRYTLPTPRWASLLSIGLGALILVAGLATLPLFVIAFIKFPEVSDKVLVVGSGAFVMGFLLFGGWRFFVYGLRKIKQEEG